MRRACQRAIQPVSPGMILALDSAIELAFVFLAQQRSAMAADIVKCTDLSLFVARDDHVCIRKLPHKVITRFRNMAGSTSAEPHIKMDRLHLSLEPFRIRVVAPRQRGGF